MSKQSDLVGVNQYSGVSGTNIYVGGTDTGARLVFDATNDVVRGWLDNTTTLGASGQRFKNLYLSGGVYLGGTGSANYLDDYEEGTWTPTITGTSGGSMGLGTSEGSYTKIGRTVILNGYVNITSAGTASGFVNIANFPFSVANTVGSTSLEASGCVGLWAGFSTAVNTVTIVAVESTNEARLLGNTGATTVGLPNLEPAQVGSSNSNMRFSITYFTT